MALLVTRIADALDPRIDDYRALRDADLRARGVFVVEGQLGVRRLLQSGRFAVRSILATDASLEGLRDLLEDGVAPGSDGVAPRSSGVAPLPVLVASHEIIRQAAGFEFHRGCLAVAERPARATAAALVDLHGPRTLVVIEAMADPENVGGVFRNAMAFGAGAVLLSPDCADPLGRKAIRVSAGGALRLGFAEMAAWPADLARLRAAGYELLALTPDGAVDLLDLGRSHRIGDRVAILLGNEGSGLSYGARREAALTVRIAMAETVDSLNVATACGIALHQLMGSSKRNAKPGSTFSPERGRNSGLSSGGRPAR
jgi:tRNA G18 (ribose-2'-O)-methylase SpoU